MPRDVCRFLQTCCEFSEIGLPVNEKCECDLARLAGGYMSSGRFLSLRFCVSFLPLSQRSLIFPSVELRSQNRPPVRVVAAVQL